MELFPEKKKKKNMLILHGDWYNIVSILYHNRVCMYIKTIIKIKSHMKTSNNKRQ